MVDILRNAKKPVSGKALAEKLEVSRQVIVQDIALLRAQKQEIISTCRGYLMKKDAPCRRIFKVHHTDEQMEDELCSIVDLGGKVVNVMINHRIYGHMEAPLDVASRRNVKEFMEGIHSGKSSPLKNITSNYHYHTVEADSEETLDLIEQVLKEKDYLVSNTP